MALTPEQLKEAHRKGGLKRWANTGTTERSAIMSAVRKGIKRGKAESYQQAIKTGK